MSTAAPTPATVTPETALPPKEPTATPAPTSGGDDDTAKRIALIAKREKALLERETQSKAELETARQKWLAEQESKKKELEPFERARKLDEAIRKRDWKAMEELGFGKDEYADYTKSLIQGGGDTIETQIKRAREEIRTEIENEFKKRDEEINKKNTELLTARQQEAAREVQNEILEKFESDKSSDNPKWPWSQLIDKVHEVAYGVIEEIYNQTAKEDPEGKGRVLKYEEALDLVENQALEEAKKRFGTYAKGEMMLKKLFAVQDAPPPEAPAKPSSPTLTALTGAAPTTPETTSTFDPEKSRKEAAKLLRWK